jgi:hypothetical protein
MFVLLVLAFFFFFFSIKAQQHIMVLWFAASPRDCKSFSPRERGKEKQQQSPMHQKPEDTFHMQFRSHSFEHESPS